LIFLNLSQISKKCALVPEKVTQTHKPNQGTENPPNTLLKRREAVGWPFWTCWNQTDF
jgi:hypothetical protein